MKTIDEAIQALRDVADFLKTRKEDHYPDDYVRFPGWDKSYDDSPEDIKAIRRAAWTVAADDIEPDEGTIISSPDLGHLIQYIADMME